jgi:hypothetical protein
MNELTWEDLDDMVEGDPLELRDTAWEEISRLRRQRAKLAGRLGVDLADLEEWMNG